jgi:multiple sugar transport system substrate-binding protein
MHLSRTLTAAALAAGLLAALAMAGTLVFNTDTSDPQPKAAFEAAVKQFEAENPGITVKTNVYDHESYRSSIRNWLTSAPPDVALWYSGARMRQFVTPGLLEDVSALFT